MKRMSPSFSKRQEGAVTLIITLLVLIAITIGSFAMVRTSTFETRMTSNDERSREALQAAQAGVDFTLAHLAQVGTDREALCADTFDAYGFRLNFEGPTASGLIFDPDVQTPFCMSLPLESMTAVTVWSQGYSRQVAGFDERESIRTLVATVDLSTPWNFLYSRMEQQDLGIPNDLPPIQALGQVTVKGGPTAARCDDVVGSSTNCYDAPGEDDLDKPGRPDDDRLNLTGVLISSAVGVQELGKATYMNDLPDPYREGDASGLKNYVGDEGKFFESVFNNPEREPTRDKDGFKLLAEGNNVANYLYKTSEGEPANYTPGVMIHVGSEGLSLSGNEAIGTRENPVALFVDGPLSMTGNSIIYGVVYVAGDASLSKGSPRIMGSLLAEREVEFRGNGGVFTTPYLPTDPQLPEDADIDQLLADYQDVRQAALRIGAWREVLAAD